MTEQTPSLAGKLLVATPSLQDSRFANAVVFLCHYDAEGAMGLMVNKALTGVSFPALLQQLGIKSGDDLPEVEVHLGGPVESGRGFVLHSPDYALESTVTITEAFALTSTVDILNDIAAGRGPEHVLMALGYAGWGEGQLDQEIQDNSWLIVDPDPQLVFGTEDAHKWPGSMAKLGIDPTMLSSQAGRA